TSSRSTSSRSWCERRTHAFRFFNDPRLITRQRRDTRQPTAACRILRTRRPTHHADYDERAIGIRKHRRTGIAHARTEAGTLVRGGGVRQTNLQRAGLAGGDKRRAAHGAAAASVVGCCKAVTRDEERIAGDDLETSRAERDWCARHSVREFDQRDVGG